MGNLQVNVRMYNVGELGDCFLLKFTEDGQASHVLIDCGSFRNSGDSITRMQEIANHIKQELTTDDQQINPLDLVVATHQHNDHVSGFTHAQTVFGSIGMKQVWLSWLDDPNDQHATNIAEGERKLTKQLQAISEKMSNVASLKGGQVAERVNDVLGFYGLDNLHTAKTPVVPQQGINNLKQLGKNVSYLNPGQVLDLPGLNAGSVKVYVLGPPRDNNLLFDINPGKGESYDAHLMLNLSMADGFLSALTNLTGKQLIDEPFFPFDKKYEQSLVNAPFLQQSYMKPVEEWRKIDTDWLDQAERVALYLDSYTNNSSLVLAFELVEAQKVLLFVGDAQTGNWLSWKTIDWKSSSISLDSLLRKTVLYKVGHHCSHNATLPECLEKMTHPDLVVMIPVDIHDPNITKKNGWKMPATNLYKRIKELTKDRVLRMDGQYEPDCDPALPEVETKWGNLFTNIDLTQADVANNQNLFVSYKIQG